MSDHDAEAEEAVTQKRAPARPNRALIAALLSATFVVGALLVALLVQKSIATQRFDSTRPSSPASAAALRESRPASLEHTDDESRSGWVGSTQARWARDGSRTITFEHAAERDVRVWMKRGRPVLAVRCLSGRTDVFVMPDTAASIESNDRHTVHVRFDDGPELEQSWNDSVDSQELFAPDGVSFARQIAQARTLRFGFTPYNAAPVVVDFDVRGFDRLIGLVAKTCRRPQ